MLAIPALIVALICSAWMLSREIKRRSFLSGKLWIATVFVFVLSTRSVSQWVLGTGSAISSNPLDEAFYGLALGASFLIATSRGVKWGRFFAGNLPMLLVYAFFLLSVFWSAEPFSSFKRIGKDFGLFFVVAAVMTEKEPLEAIRAIFIRSACIIFPLSVVTNRYFPSISRGFALDGSMMLTGLTTQKNSLGEIVLIFSTMLLWDYVERRKLQRMSLKRSMPSDQMLLLALGIFLLFQSQSKTALITLGICAALTLRPARFTSRAANMAVFLMAFATPFLLFFSHQFASLIEPIVTAMGRNMTFTGRTVIWDHIDLQTVNPIVGAGYWNFWSGPEGKAISEAIHWSIPNAHCGYLDIYLDGGICGLALLGIALLAYGFRLARREARTTFDVVRLALLATAIIYNLSESSFFRIGPLWLTTLMVTLSFPMRQARRKPSGKTSDESAKEQAFPEHLAAFGGRL